MNNPKKTAALKVRNEYINSVVPKLQAIFAEGVKFKVNGDPHKKFKDKFDAVLADTPKYVRAYMDYDSGALKTDVRYECLPDHNGYSSWDYLNEYTYLWDHNAESLLEFKPLVIRTDEDMKKARAELDRLLKLQQEIAAQISEQKRILEV